MKLPDDFQTIEGLEQDPETTIDVVLVLGSPHSHAAMISRIKQLVDAQSAKKVVISGYNGEAENIAARCVSCGINPSTIIIENQSSNTQENIDFSMRLVSLCMPTRGLRVGILCKDYALLRCRYTAKKAINDKYGVSLFFYSFSVKKPEDEEGIYLTHLYKKMTAELSKVLNYSSVGIIDALNQCNADAIRAGIGSLDNAIVGLEHKNSGNKNEAESCKVVGEKNQTYSDLEIASVTLEFKDRGRTTVGETSVILRPDSVAILPYDPETKSVILVEQFRAGIYLRSAQMASLEVVAGYIDADESPKSAALRELKEETSLVPQRIFKIMEYFPAPTLSTEKIHVFFALIKESKLESLELKNENEHLKIRRMPISLIDRMLLDNEFNNSLTILTLLAAKTYQTLNYES